MSRGQESSTYNTATTDSSADQATSTADQAKAQGDISNYETQLSKFAADNPYGEGGAYESATNRQISDTAEGQSDAARESLQGQALRTGQNAAGADATAEAIGDANERSQSGEEAAATQDRLTKGAVYGNEVLGASSVPASMEAGLAGTNLSAAGGTLNTAASAAQTPSFWDTLGSTFASQLGKTAAGGNQ